MEATCETDGQFFDNLRKMERDILKDDPEAIAFLDAEEAAIKAEEEAEENADE